MRVFSGSRGLIAGLLAIVLLGMASQAAATYHYYTEKNASIGNRVWVDANMNGVQDEGEKGAANIKVLIGDCRAGRWLKWAKTNQYGKYNFNNLAAGSYSIVFFPEYDNPDNAGAVISPHDAGPGYLDSDAKYIRTSAHWGSYGQSKCVWLESGHNKKNIDFGFYVPENNKLPEAVDDSYEWSVGDIVSQNIVTENDDQGDGCAAVEVLSGELPDGVELAVDGELTGTPTTAGEYWIEYQLTDCNGDTSTALVDFVVTQKIAQCAIEAVGDDLSSNAGGDALWIPGISRDLVFEAESTVMQTLPNGNLTIEGVVVDGDLRFAINMNFSGFMAESDSPKLDLLDSAYLQNGGSIDPATWDFYTELSGTLTGLSGAWSGAVLDLSLRGVETQLGIGANGRNGANGLSGWFIAKASAASTQLPNGVFVDAEYHGEILVDLRDPGACEPLLSVVEYCAVSAETGDFNKWSGGHSLFIPAISRDLRFEPQGFVTQTLPNGDLTLKGTVIDGALQFEVDWVFSDKVNASADPKLFLLDEAYVSNGGPIDPSLWMFYQTLTGTLTGVGGEWDGVVFTPSIRDYFAQIGDGASGKNTNFGFSSWFNIAIAAAPNGLPGDFSIGQQFHGDLDIDLLEQCDVPVVKSLNDDEFINSLRAGVNGNVLDNDENLVAPVTVEFVSGDIPNGVTLSNDGSVTGFSQEAGIFVSIIRITDAEGFTATSQLTINSQ